MSAAKKKTVSAYPIPVSIFEMEGQIVKLARSGFLVKTKTPLKVGAQTDASFMLPVMNYEVQFSGVVVKTYDRFGGDLGENDANVMLAEIGFRRLASGNLEQITSFIQKIGQK